MKTCGTGGRAAPILNLGIRWRRVINFTLLRVPPWQKSPTYPSDRRLGRSQRRSGSCGEEINLMPLTEIEPLFLDLPGHSSSLCRLSYMHAFEILFILKQVVHIVTITL
jgi:hypothetical protein